jgi:hypothetical protein
MMVGTLRHRTLDLTREQRPAPAAPPPRTSYRVLEFRPVTKATLRGFATIDLGNGLALHDVSIHRQGKRTWAMPPGRPLIGPDGSVVLDEAGAKVIVPILRFASGGRRTRWMNAVIEAVEREYPDALRDGPAKQPPATAP